MEGAAGIGKARQLLEEGHEKAAARELTEVVLATHDPAQLEEIRRLAEGGLERAGMFGKGRWREILRLADLRMEKAKAGAGGM